MMQSLPSSGVPDDDAEQPRADPLAPRPVDGLSDSELVARVRLGDAEAFEQLFHTYYEPLCAFVLGYVESSAVAEDVVQETFVRIWERRTAWDVRGKVRSYLYSAVRNRALMQLRHARIVARSQERAPHEARLSGRAPAASDEGVRMDEMAQALAQAIARLPARRQQAYTLRWQHELSLAEIATIMGVTVKCIEAHLAAASKAIREAMAEFV